MTFDIVVAADRDRGIARAGDLPWHLPGDLAHFKRVTSTTRDPAKRNAVIMGRKTWQSIPPKYAPLPGRWNLVLTRAAGAVFHPEVQTASSLDEALALCAARPEIEASFVVGGADVYRQALAHPALGALYYTRIDQQFDCDTFFPAFEDRLTLVEVLEERREGDVAYRVELWRRGA